MKDKQIHLYTKPYVISRLQTCSQATDFFRLGGAPVATSLGQRQLLTSNSVDARPWLLMATVNYGEAEKHDHPYHMLGLLVYVDKLSGCIISLIYNAARCLHAT